MINKWQKDIDKSLRLFLRDIERKYKLRLISNTLFSSIKDFLVRKGKRIRPLLFLIGYQGYARKNIAYRQLLRSALAFELLHDFMLIHDDIIDKSKLRRGKPTLHNVFNKKLRYPAGNELGSFLSIVAGDLLFALAVEAFLSIKEDAQRKQNALKKFSESAVFTSVGEFIDITSAAKNIEKIKLKDVSLIYVYKTAKYTFEYPLIIAATLAGVKVSELAKLSKMAILIGQAFQIQDDLLDVFSTRKIIGKSVLNDLSESKKTLLLWKTYRNLKSADKKIIKKLLEKKTKNYSDLIKFRALIRKADAQAYCVNRIDSLLKKGGKILSKLKMKNKFKLLLQEFLHSLFLKDLT